MRFSLGALMLVVVWCAAGTTVWELREPWRLDSQTPATSSKLKLPKQAVAPDGRRALTRRISWGYGPLMIVNIPTGETPPDIHWYMGDAAPLFEFDLSATQTIQFVDDDTIAFSAWMADPLGPLEETRESVLMYKRRFPEWWWGHFYRPEVWVFVLLSGVLLWRACGSARAWRHARRVHGLGMAEAPSSTTVGVSV